jgi:anti-sigma regulatory factor (Ser/Thr protein kinase)
MKTETVVAELTVPGHAGSLRLIRALLREVAAAQGAGADWTHDLVLAVDEACQNVIRHGYGGGTVRGDIRVQVAADAGGLSVRVSDDAPCVGPAGPRPRPLEDERPGGLGLHLMQTLTDVCRWDPPVAEAGNTLHLRKDFKTLPAVGEGTGTATGEEHPK